MKILCVDDAKTMLFALEHTLKGAGHEVSTAESGELAIEQVKVQEFDLIISDVNMPGLTGFEMLELMRKESLLPAKTHVMMLTTETSESQKMRGKALGVRAWLIKPYDPESLLMVLDKLIKTFS